MCWSFVSLGKVMNILLIKDLICLTIHSLPHPAWLFVTVDDCLFTIDDGKHSTENFEYNQMEICKWILSFFYVNIVQKFECAMLEDDDDDYFIFVMFPLSSTLWLCLIRLWERPLFSRLFMELNLNAQNPSENVVSPLLVTFLCFFFGFIVVSHRCCSFSVVSRCWVSLCLCFSCRAFL